MEVIVDNIQGLHSGSDCRKHAMSYIVEVIVDNIHGVHSGSDCSKLRMPT